MPQHFSIDDPTIARDCGTFTCLIPQWLDYGLVRIKEWQEHINQYASDADLPSNKWA